MHSSSPIADPESLLEHAGWMRRLAMSLVGDPQLADDLSQETWLRALEHPPRGEEPLRGWLATVMRNLLRQRQRTEARRHVRERMAARDEAQSSSLELVERVSTQQELVRAVLELEEPYRTTVLRRYFEESSPGHIAAREGIPVSTVKTRLARGLDMLRARLDGSFGADGKTWLAALLPVIHGSRGTEGASPVAHDTPGTSGGAPNALSKIPLATPFSLGAALVNSKLLVLFVAATAIGATIVLWSREGASSPGKPKLAAPAGVSPATLAEPEPGSEVPELASAEPERREVEAASVSAPAAPPLAVEAVGFLFGRVLDAEARPLGGVQVVHSRGRLDSMAAVEPDTRAVETRPDGSFRFRSEAPGGHFFVRDDVYTTVLLGRAVPEGSEARPNESIVVVAPKIELAGRVVDPAGQPLPGAHVRLCLPEDFRGRFPRVLDESVDQNWSAETDREGRFELADTPTLAGAILVVGLDGYAVKPEPVPRQSDTNLVFVLERPDSSQRTLTGEVLDDAGDPVAEALVSLGIDTTETDSDGRFAFDLDAPETFNRRVRNFMPDFSADTLIAVKPGYLPGRLGSERRDADGSPIWPERVVLRLGTEPRVVAGRVLDEAGNGLPGIRVWIADPTFFGGLGDAGQGGSMQVTHVENVLGGSAPGWSFVETDERGAFRIAGLLDREYTLRAMDPNTLLRIEEREVRAGREHLVLHMPDDASYAVLRGRVVDSRGNPLEGVEVFPMCDAFRTRFQGQVISTRHSRVEGVVTDAEGRFRLEDVPRDLAYLRLNGSDTIPLEWGRGVEGGLATLVGEDYEDVEVTVHRRCHFQIELLDANEADEIAILDANSETLAISEFQGTGRRDGPRMSLVNGRSNTLAVGDTAAMLVLYREGQRVRETPIDLVPGERITLRP